MSFDKNLIFAYCQPVSNLFCGAVYCVVGQVIKPGIPSYDWDYSNKETLYNQAAPYIHMLEEEGNINVYTKIITPNKINEADLQISKYIQLNLRMLVWRYIYNHKIKEPKVHFCGECDPFDLDLIHFVQGEYAEDALIKAIAYLKRHSLIETHYAPTYEDCALLDNYGALVLSSLPVLKKAEYREDFFLKVPLLLRLPNLMLESFQYVPDKPEGKPWTKTKQVEFDYCLCSVDSLDLPPWWYLVQHVDYDDPTDCYNYQTLRELSHYGHKQEAFKCWLDKMQGRLEDKYLSIIELARKADEKS
jgi:hypothetical protein